MHNLFDANASGRMQSQTLSAKLINNHQYMKCLTVRRATLDESKPIRNFYIQGEPEYKNHYSTTASVSPILSALPTSICAPHVCN